MAYEITFTPRARKDFQELTTYLIEQYDASDAALHMVDEIESRTRHLREFPYSHPLYAPPQRPPMEVRYLPIGNYTIFYVILEPEKIVEVRRIINQRMDITSIDMGNH